MNVKVQGEVDVSNIFEFKEVLLLGIESKSPNVVMDCNDLKYIDSTGLGVLGQRFEEIQSPGRRYKTDSFKTLFAENIHDYRPG